MDWKTIYSQLRTLNLIILLILSLASWFFMPGSITLGVILGGLIILANFSLLQHTISRAFSLDGTMQKGKAAIITKYYFRLLGLGTILYILITRGLVDPVGLAVGLSTIVFGITLVGVQRAVRNTNEGAV